MGTPTSVPIFVEDEGRRTKDGGRKTDDGGRKTKDEGRMSNLVIRPVSGIVLAGGKSRRMGHDKAFLDLDGMPLVARVIERVRAVCDEVIIVANDTDAYARFGLRVVSDVYPGKGSLGGIYSGLLAAREEHALVVACDLPFLNAALLRYLISLAPQADVVIPRAHAPRGSARYATRYEDLDVKESGLQATHALYSKRCLEPMRARLLANDLRIINFFDEVRVRVVEPDEVARFDSEGWSFFNVNTPEDWRVAQAHIKRVLQ
ncbi:MAG: molybdenum cofactor guanylyltransferase [Anaerolineae bacterium]|nr:molybdenum cofactor guanylyltransferase [Anaerolineae bacterium]